MAPRPRTYGARRSYVKSAGEIVHGVATDESEQRTERSDRIATWKRNGNGKGKDLGTSFKGRALNSVPHVWEAENESAFGTSDGERTTPRTLYDERGSTAFTPATTFPRNERTSARDIPSPGRSIKHTSSRLKSTKEQANGSATRATQDHVTKQDIQSTPINITSPSQAKATFLPNGFTKDHQQSPRRHGIDLDERPNDPDKFATWIAQLIRKVHQESNALTAVSEPRQEDSNGEPGQDNGMSEAVENVEDVRMTRGKEKKRLQQLKAKESANALNGTGINGVGRPLRAKDAASVIKRLRDDLNAELKERLFGYPSISDVPANFAHHNACGRLLLNAIADLASSAAGNSAAVLKSAFEERRDDAPFLSALETLASSSQVMRFINFFFDNEDVLRWEALNADDSRLSIGSEKSGATTITETSDSANRADKSMFRIENSKSTSSDNVTGRKYSKIQQPSQEVIQALEAATMVLFQIQQGEAGADYITPYASVGMYQNPIGQHQLFAHGVTSDPMPPQFFNHQTVWVPPVGANLSNYASPYAVPQVLPSSSYSSPYSNPLNKPPANYASPYAHPIAPDQINVPSVANGVDHQANEHNSHESCHAKGATRMTHRKLMKAEARKETDESASKSFNNQEEVARRQSNMNGDQDMDNGKDDEAFLEGIKNDKHLARNDTKLNGVDAGDANESQRDGQDETSRDDEFTDNEMPTVKPNEKDVTPPAEDHRLFTGERLGDFTSLENIDWLLTVGNGGKIPTPRKKRRTSSPSQSSSSPVDAEVMMEVSQIINEITQYGDWRGRPGGTAKQLFYASAEGQRLAVELRRLMAMVKPVVNTIMPAAESQARLRFYQQLQGRAFKEKRVREIHREMHRMYGAPIQIQQWIPPAPRPPGPIAIAPAPLPVPPILPSNGPIEVPFVRRGNVIAAPPGGRDIEEEKRAETYSYPPKPGPRTGHAPRGRKRKRDARR